MTILSTAAATENGHALECLLATGKVDVDSRDNAGQTPFSRAAERGYGDVLEALMATGKVDINSRDNSGMTPFHWAVQRGQAGLVELLLATGKVDMDLRDDSGKTPLRVAVEWAEDEAHDAVIQLLRNASDDDADRTLLVSAPAAKQEVAVDILPVSGTADRI
ncbi:ankyrin repeat-containing domain protein [Lasiosphaeria miniovina]|uniref:Ankyrin repeat-containing domain protein n=1 Tax=Lasiosphaeria miniovina TaxID=1954250 RepID=A0AA40EGT5_9PEZI|nr:ankyrin repeat-containing domain protein [Lasiosphaeria miniovina]KAK0735048.1 ankyrin repeat-containing domain protein [Lasiosphaeria miniovina]